MNIIGTTTINPLLFYTGKIAGYLTWTIAIVQICGIQITPKISLFENATIACILLFAGTIFTVFSLINLGKSTRLGLPTDNTEFKTHGLYAFSRNPMYVGFNLFTIAAMLYLLQLYIIILGVYSIIIYHKIILGEEQYLEKRFGDEYCYYRKKTRRYV